MNPEIYKLDIRKISCENLRTAYFIMSEERKTKCRALRREEDRKLCIAADMLIRKILSEKCGIKPEDIIFSETQNGKPFSVNCSLPFSISHSGDYAAVAVGNKNSIGIDIEKIRPVKAGVMRYFCSDADVEYINAGQTKGLIEDPVILERLFRVWTFKESYVKCRGTGIGDETIKDISFDAECSCSAAEDGYAISLYEE